MQTSTKYSFPAATASAQVAAENLPQARATAPPPARQRAGRRLKQHRRLRVGEAAREAPRPSGVSGCDASSSAVSRLQTLGGRQIGKFLHRRPGTAQKPLDARRGLRRPRLGPALGGRKSDDQPLGGDAAAVKAEQLLRAMYSASSRGSMPTSRSTRSSDELKIVLASTLAGKRPRSAEQHRQLDVAHSQPVRLADHDAVDRDRMRATVARRSTVSKICETGRH